MSAPRSRRSVRRAADVIDAGEAGLLDPPGASSSSSSSSSSASSSSSDAAGDTDGANELVPAGATTEPRALDAQREPALWASPAFFRRAAEELVASTQTGRELAGACFVRERRGRPLLVGLRREMSGEPGRVGIDPTWGAVLWHTHPGLKGSLAAFSLDDLEVARQAGKPLLVIGFVGFSLDVLSTLALPFGWRAALASAGVKGLLALERAGHLPTSLLELGVGARVCWPSGAIRPVLRRGAPPWRKAFDDMSFVVDTGVGAVERSGQRALRELWSLFVDPKGR